MATAAQPQRPQEIKRRQMEEVKAPEQMQFTKVGQLAAGILIAIEPVEIKNKQAMEYTFMAENGNGRFTCLGTADLNKKLMPAHIGHYCEVRYERDDDSFTKQGQSAMKIFKVTVAKELEPGFSKTL